MCNIKIPLEEELTEEELANVYFISAKFASAHQALQPNCIDFSLFNTEGQVYEYFKSAYDILAEAAFLQTTFHNDLKKRLGLKKDIQIMVDKEVIYVLNNDCMDN